MTDVPTKLREHAIVFLQPKFAEKQNLGLCQDKEAKNGFTSSDVTETWIYEESSWKSQC